MSSLVMPLVYQDICLFYLACAWLHHLCIPNPLPKTQKCDTKAPRKRRITKKGLEKPRITRIARIGNSHLRNLRRGAGTRERRPSLVREGSACQADCV